MVATPPLNIVYIEPEIPQNTGSTARLCAAAGIPLHLVGRLGFRIDESSVKRAGLDYWKFVSVHTHPDMESLMKLHPAAKFHFFSKTAEKLYTEPDYGYGDFLVFGSETKGLPQAVMEAHSDSLYRIPILSCVRSLNLATATGIVAFEALRRLGFPHVEKSPTA